MTAASSPAAPGGSQRAFATPQEAVQATIAAADHNDTAALLELFGPDGTAIVESGDPSEDKDGRAEFARLAREKAQFDQDPIDADRTIVTIGDQDWPFPVPLVRTGGKWRFDSSQGRLEILARRIGRNEMDAFEICRGYVETQLEYAAESRDGDGILKYAQNIVSSSGKHDGLYWDDAPESLISKGFAAAEPECFRTERHTCAVSWLLLSCAEITGIGCPRRRLRLCRQQQDDWRFRVDCMAGGVRRVRSPNPDDQSPRRRL